MKVYVGSIMNEIEHIKIPSLLDAVESETKAIGFGMASEKLTGAMLRMLAATKRHAQILELGTGTGISATWLLDGMDADSHLTTVDNVAAVVEIARRYLG